MEQEIRILLVDDEPLVLRSMEKTLLREGFDVETANDVQRGLEVFRQALAEKDPFQLAVLDLNMPLGKGKPVESTAGLRLLNELLHLDANLPVVVLTAFDAVGLAKDAVKRGAKAYLVKGREDELVDIINEIIEA